MKYIECIQGDPQWLAARVGRITMSNASTARGRMKVKRGDKPAGSPTDECLKHAHEVALGRIIGRPWSSTYVTPAMARGSVLEPEAREAYEVVTGNAVMESGIYLTDDEVFGASIDGLVGSDGTIEIKCPVNPLQLYKVWHDNDISDYIDQIQGGLWITGREWCDFVMWAPQLQEVGKSLFYKRVHRDDDYIDGVEGQPGLVDDLRWFASLVDRIEAFWRGQPAEAAQQAATESLASQEA